MVVRSPNKAREYAAASNVASGAITRLATGFTAIAGAAAASAADTRLVRSSDRPEVPVGFGWMATVYGSGRGVRRRFTTTPTRLG
jgi:hypothetical protein